MQRGKVGESGTPEVAHCYGGASDLTAVARPNGRVCRRGPWCLEGSDRSSIPSCEPRDRGWALAGSGVSHPLSALLHGGAPQVVSPRYALWRSIVGNCRFRRQEVVGSPDEDHGPGGSGRRQAATHALPVGVLNMFNQSA